MYRSPFTILPGLGSGPLPDRSALLLERRKLQAEFELQGADSILVNGQELHRQDVTALFEELQEEDSLAFHRAISAQPGLRRFLETGVFEGDARWDPAPLDDWWERISPHFAAAQDVFYKAVVKSEVPPETLQRYERLPKLLLPQDTEVAYRSAGRLLVEKKNALLLLLNRARSGAAITAEEVSGWARPAQVALINALPADFEQLRYAIADALNNICVAFDRAKKYKLALKAIEAAASIHLDGGELRSLIPRNLDLIRSRRSGKSYWWVVVLVIALIRVFLSLSSQDRGPQSNIRWILQNQQAYSPENISFADAGQDWRCLTYESIAFAINSRQPSTSTISWYQTTWPHSTGDDPYSTIFTGFNKASADPPATAVRELTTCNRSHWDFILLAQDAAGSWTHSWYLPKGACLSLSLPADGSFRLHGCAGRNWIDSRVQPFQFFSPNDTPVNAQLLGGFDKLPANAASFCPHGILDLRLQASRINTDSLIVEDDGSRANSIDLRTVQRSSEIPAEATSPGLP